MDRVSELLAGGKHGDAAGHSALAQGRLASGVGGSVLCHFSADGARADRRAITFKHGNRVGQGNASASDTTSEAQVLGKLPGGEFARLERRRGNFIYIRTNLAAGWVERRQFGLIANLP